MTLVRKIGGALGVGIIGWVLTGVGYEGYNAATTAADALAQEDPGSVFALQYAKADSTKIADFLKDNEAVVSDKLNDLAANGKISFDTSGFSVASVADNVNKVLLTIRLLMGISIAVLIAFALFSSFRFHLNNKILARMRYFSEKIKNGEYDELTDEEKQERIDLITKHYGKYDKEEDEARIAEITATAKAAGKAAEGECE